MPKEIVIPKGVCIYKTEASLTGGNPYFGGTFTVPESKGAFEESADGDYSIHTNKPGEGMVIFIKRPMAKLKSSITKIEATIETLKTKIKSHKDIIAGTTDKNKISKTQKLLDKDEAALKKEEAKLDLDKKKEAEEREKLKGEKLYKVTELTLDAFIAHSGLKGTYSPTVNKTTSSGITFGFGFDMGVTTKSIVEEALKITGFSKATVDFIMQFYGKRSIAAFEGLKQILDQKLELTREQTLDNLEYRGKLSEEGIKKAVPQVKDVYPPLIDIFTKKYFAAPGTGTKWTKDFFAKNPDFTSKTPAEQCSILGKVLKLDLEADLRKARKPVTEEALKSGTYTQYVDLIQTKMAEGYEIKVKDGYLEIEDILSDDAASSQFLDEYKGSAGGVTPREAMLIDAVQRFFLTNDVYKEKKWYKGKIDGNVSHFSSKNTTTKNGLVYALKMFQNEQGLTESGRIDTATQKVMFDKKFISLDDIKKFEESHTKKPAKKIDEYPKNEKLLPNPSTETKPTEETTPKVETTPTANTDVMQYSEDFLNMLRDIKEDIKLWFQEIERQQICHEDEDKYSTLLTKIQEVLQES